MKVRKLITALCLAAIGFLPALATPLTIELRDGSLIEIPSESLDLTFENSYLKAGWVDGSREFPVSEIASFYFFETSTSSTTIADEADGSVLVYSPDGVLRGSFGSSKEATLNLGKGIYIFKTQSRTFKTVIK